MRRLDGTEGVDPRPRPDFSNFRRNGGGVVIRLLGQQVAQRVGDGVGCAIGTASLDQSELNCAKEVIIAFLCSVTVCNAQYNWVILHLSGPLAIAALERIWAIDIHSEFLPAGSFTRTMAEQFGAIVMHEAYDQFLLLSASSSAHSFVHTVEISIKYVSIGQS